MSGVGHPTVFMLTSKPSCSGTDGCCALPVDALHSTLQSGLWEDHSECPWLQACFQVAPSICIQTGSPHQLGWTESCPMQGRWISWELQNHSAASQSMRHTREREKRPQVPLRHPRDLTWCHATSLPKTCSFPGDPVSQQR